MVMFQKNIWLVGKPVRDGSGRCGRINGIWGAKRAAEDEISINWEDGTHDLVSLSTARRYVFLATNQIER